MLEVRIPDFLNRSDYDICDDNLEQIMDYIDYLEQENLRLLERLSEAGIDYERERVFDLIKDKVGKEVQTEKFQKQRRSGYGF